MGGRWGGKQKELLVLTMVVGWAVQRRLEQMEIKGRRFSTGEKSSQTTSGSTNIVRRCLQCQNRPTEDSLEQTQALLGAGGCAG